MTTPTPTPTPTTTTTSPASVTPPASGRIASIDAYRGFVMLLMMAEVLELGEVAKALPQSGFWAFLAHHQSHVPWRGASLHDMIQPSFSLLVGVSLPFSLASRRAKGQSTGRMLAHAAWRAVVLVLLGVFLRSVGKSQTYWTFEDTLSQIGLGYVPLFLLGLAPTRWVWAAVAAILVGYAGAFAAYPAPRAGFDYPSVNVPADDPELAAAGTLAAHYNKNSNLAWGFDRWFLNLFPRESVFTHNRGGYATLSFIPTLATMLLGLIAGRWLQQGPNDRARLMRLIGFGVAGIALAVGLDRAGVCPIVKRIWTPSWVLFSGGIAYLMLAAFYAVIDAAGWRGWAWILRVIGSNSIAAYVLAHLTTDFITSAFWTHFGRGVFEVLGPAYEPLLAGAAVLTVNILILVWMARNRVFVRI
jgi:predicted acyltransferase